MVAPLLRRRSVARTGTPGTWSRRSTPQRSYGDGATVNQAPEEGWKQEVSHAMADGILTQAEEPRLREFRDRLALDSFADDSVQLTSYPCQRKERKCPL